MSESAAAVRELYPFLHGDRKDRAAEERSLIESVRRKAADSVAAKQAFFAASSAELLVAARLIADVFRHGGRMYSMGNGGSSCDAAHFAVEFQHPVTAGRPALPALHLSDLAMISAVANDVGYRHVFVRQLIAQARRGDGLIGFSTSGNAESLMAAFARAKAMGLITIGLTGHDGGEMAASAGLDCCLVVRSDSIHRIQETHVVIYHILWDLVHTLLADDRGALGGSATDGTA
jgi:D-sedoheptulose 7-phosphate isomerase